MSHYKPGTVAVATVRGVPNVRILRAGGPGVSGRDQTPFWWSAEYVIDWRSHNDADVTDVRPLVVLDLENAERTVSALRAAASIIREDYVAVLLTLRDQIEAQTRPPKPAEPTGLGAVVRDRHDVKWVRVDNTDSLPWASADGLGDWTAYTDIDVAEVLSEGVPA